VRQTEEVSITFIHVSSVVERERLKKLFRIMFFCDFKLRNFRFYCCRIMDKESKFSMIENFSNISYYIFDKYSKRALNV